VRQALGSLSRALAQPSLSLAALSPALAALRDSHVPMPGLEASHQGGGAGEAFHALTQLGGQVGQPGGGGSHWLTGGSLYVPFTVQFSLLLP
jgi:hypothetical protein